MRYLLAILFCLAAFGQRTPRVVDSAAALVALTPSATAPDVILVNTNNNTRLQFRYYPTASDSTNATSPYVYATSTGTGRWKEVRLTGDLTGVTIDGASIDATAKLNITNGTAVNLTGTLTGVRLDGTTIYGGSGSNNLTANTMFNLGLRGSNGETVSVYPTAHTTKNIASLVGLNTGLVTTNATVEVRGYYEPGDGGGGTFYYTSAEATNRGTVFQAGSASFVWKRLVPETGVTAAMFGAKGDDSTDDAGAINAAILWGAQNGVPVTITEGRYRHSTPLLVHDNTTLLGTPNGILRPNISGSDGTATYSFLRNTNLFSGLGSTPRTNVAALATNIVLRGLKFEAVTGSSTNVRGISLIGVHNVVLDDIEIDRTFDNWAFTFFAQDLRASKLRVKNNQTIYEDGIHVLGGERMVFSDSQIQSGDDSLAIGWDASDTFCRDIVFNGATLKSYRAFPIKVFAAPEMTSGSTCVEKVIFANIVGEGGINRNGGVFLYEQGTPRGAITNVTLSNVKLRVNSGTHDGTNPYGVWILGGSEIDLNNVTVQGNDGYSLYLDSPKGPIRVNGGSYGTPENASTESVFIYQGFGNAVTFNNVSVSDTTYRPLRAIESDVIYNGGVLNSGGSLHIAFQTATNATRTLRVSGSTLTGSSVVPVQATGTSSNLLTYIFTGNVTPTGSAITGISASNFYQFGNVGMSVYDLFSNLRVNNLVATNATLGQSTGGNAANLIGGTGGARVLTMQRDSLSQSVGLGVGTDAMILWNETDNVGIGYLFGDATSVAWLGGAGNGGAAPRALAIRPEDASSGTNSPGTSLTLQGSAGTGSSTTGGDIIFATPDAGASGTTVQTRTTKATIQRDGDLQLAANIELGNASDTTLARSAAGVLSVEGNAVPSPASPSTGQIIVYTNSAWTAMTPGASGIGGSTGSTDNSLLRADGTGGSTLQNSAVIIDDYTSSTANNVAIKVDDGSTANISAVITPKGTGAFIIGPKPDGTSTGGNARGQYAADFSRRTAATFVASGNYSFSAGLNAMAAGTSSAAIGNLNQATGNYSFAAGDLNNATSADAVAIGYGNTASAVAAVAIGFANTASGTGAIAVGYESISDKVGQFSVSGSKFATIGDAQTGIITLRNSTASTTPTVLFTDGSSARLTIPNNNFWTFTILLSGTTATATSQRYAYKLEGCIGKGTTAGSTAMPVAVTKTVIYEHDSAADVDATADTTNGALSITVTAANSTATRWSASVTWNQVAFP